MTIESILMAIGLFIFTFVLALVSLYGIDKRGSKHYPERDYPEDDEWDEEQKNG